MFQSPDITLIVEFIFMFYKEKPIDWLLDHILWVKVCNPEKDAVSSLWSFKCIQYFWWGCCITCEKGHVRWREEMSLMVLYNQMEACVKLVRGTGTLVTSLCRIKMKMVSIYVWLGTQVLQHSCPLLQFWKNMLYNGGSLWASRSTESTLTHCTRNFQELSFQLFTVAPP